jgi:hypothetical protein
MMHSIKAILLVLTLFGSAHAAYLPVQGAPLTDSIGRPYTSTAISSRSVDIAGIGVVWAEKFDGENYLERRAIRWSNATDAVELGHLGTDNRGVTRSNISAINSGVAVGFSEKYVAYVWVGQRAVRWDPGSMDAIELGHIGTDPSGSTFVQASAINKIGTIVGMGYKYAPGSYTDLGTRAIRWDAGGIIATELGNLGTANSGGTGASAAAINSGGTAVGYGYKHVAGTYLGTRAVRWDAGGTAATELDTLGTNSAGEGTAFALDINDSGVVVGTSTKYVSNSIRGRRAVRWEPGAVAVTELGILGVNAIGANDSNAVAINDAGTAVGYSSKYVDGAAKGQRAVRWDLSTTNATELGNIGTNSAGVTWSVANFINAGGIAVGSANKYSGGELLGDRAVLWDRAGVAFDLNSSIDPASGWTLTAAYSISDSNFITGLGDFDPDGVGPVTSVQRAFILDVNSVIPEPTLGGGVTVSFLLLSRRRTDQQRKLVSTARVIGAD